MQTHSPSGHIACTRNDTAAAFKVDTMAPHTKSNCEKTPHDEGHASKLRAQDSKNSLQNLQRRECMRAWQTQRTLQNLLATPLLFTWQTLGNKMLEV